MKRVSLACGIVFVAATSAACLQPSIYPLITPETSTFEPALVGEWRCGGEVWTFVERERQAGRFYEVQILESGQTAEMIAWTGRIGDDAFIDFRLDDFATKAPDIENDFVGWHIIVAHTFGRVAIERDVLRLRMLSAEWTEKYAESQPAGLGRSMEDDGLLLTAPTERLRELAAKYAGNEEAFPVQVELVRSPGDPSTGRCYGSR